WGHDRPCGLSAALAASWRRSFGVWRCAAAYLAARRGSSAHALYRARACRRHPSSRHHAPPARIVPGRAGRAGVPPPACRGGSVATSWRGIAGRGDRTRQRRRLRHGSRRGVTERSGSHLKPPRIDERETVLGVPFTELLWLAIAVIIAGVITGLLAGLFGVGGGAVIVPVLYEVFRLLGVPDEVRMQLCIGTSIAIIVPTTLRSYLAHREKDLVIPGIIRIWSAPAVLGVVCGAVIAAFAPSEVFKIAFIILATFIASKFLLGGDRWNIANDLPNAA